MGRLKLVYLPQLVPLEERFMHRSVVYRQLLAEKLERVLNINQEIKDGPPPH